MHNSEGTFLRVFAKLVCTDFSCSIYAAMLWYGSHNVSTFQTICCLELKSCHQGVSPCMSALIASGAYAQRLVWHVSVVWLWLNCLHVW